MRESLRSLAYELTLAESRERERIARELHDGIAQVLVVAQFKLGELRRTSHEGQTALLDELGELLAQASQVTRSTTFELGAPALRLGLHEALLSLVQRLNKSAGPVFSLEGVVPELSWPEEVQAVLLRVVRELCFNVQRHAQASRGRICVHSEAGQLQLSVHDDGMGMDPNQPPRGLSDEGGFGLYSARGQLRALGGSLVLHSALGAGTTVTMLLPLAGPLR